MSTAAAPTTRVESVLQRAELELWRDNIDGALDLLARAHTLAPDHRYAARAEEIRSWRRHLESRGAYAAAYEEYYRRSKGRLDLKRLERDVRILLGRKTRKTVRRVVEYPEYQWLEREIIERRPARVLDAGCGEGRIALCLGHRCPSIRVTAVEVSATNVGIARRLNRFRNVAFQHGLVEDMIGAMAPGSFDLAYSFAVLEHVPDVETTVGALLRTLRPVFSCVAPLPRDGRALYSARHPSPRSCSSTSRRQRTAYWSRVDEHAPARRGVQSRRRARGDRGGREACRVARLRIGVDGRGPRRRPVRRARSGGGSDDPHPSRDEHQ